MKRLLCALVAGAALVGCGTDRPQPGPTTTSTTERPTTTTSRPRPTTTTTRPATTTTSTTTTTAPAPPPFDPPPVVGSTCDAIGRQVTEGEPGYRGELDRDGDGLACEEYAYSPPPDEGDYLMCIVDIINTPVTDPRGPDCEGVR